MNLIRFAGRALLGSYFIVNGAKAVMNPTPLVSDAEPVAQKIVPLAKDVAPEQVKDFIPEETSTLIRVDGAMQLLGGLSMVTGVGRRIGGALVAAALAPKVLATRPGLPGTQSEKEERGRHFFHTLALFGAALVVSQDTAGSPSLAWRADQQRRHLAKAADKQKKQLTKDAGKTQKNLAKSFDHAQKDAAKQVKQVRKQVADVLPS